ncbi:hypothetical protein [Bdellovibrio bacteriovorus]|uniref:hypothetical protein n=1 Tax=Bdellovibrio bacteriovorus TaxID=959 RepID=UPI0035A61E8A
MKLMSLLTALVFVFSSVAAQAATLEELQKKLQAYSAEDLKAPKAKDDEAVSEKTTEMLKTIEDTVDLATKGKEKVSADVLQQLARVAVLTFEADPSLAAAELLLPLYKKEKKAFDKAMRTLPSKDNKSLKDALKDADREDEEGNG